MAAPSRVPQSRGAATQGRPYHVRCHLRADGSPSVGLHDSPVCRDDCHRPLHSDNQIFTVMHEGINVMGKVKLTVLESSCRCGYCKKGDEFIVEDLCPPLCHELWNVAYPFVYTLE